MIAPIAALLASVLVVGQFLLLMHQRRVAARAKARADRLSRFVLALSRANRAVLRIDDEASLCREASRICVETGHAALACVYVLDGAVARRIAMAGPAQEALKNVPDPLDLNDPQVQATYTAQVLRDGQRRVSNDYALDANAGRWREEAVKRGIRAITWIPLRRAGEVRAVLMLCAEQWNFFDDELLALLDELGEDLSFALDNIDAKQARRLAQCEIEAGRDRFSALFFGAPLPMAIVSIKERRIVEVNQALCERYGLARAELLGSATASHAYGFSPEDRERFYQVLAADGRVRNLQLQIRQANGDVHSAILNAVPLPYLGEDCVLISSLELDAAKP